MAESPGLVKALTADLGMPKLATASHVQPHNSVNSVHMLCESPLNAILPVIAPPGNTEATLRPLCLHVCHNSRCMRLPQKLPMQLELHKSYVERLYALITEAMAYISPKCFWPPVQTWTPSSK